MERNDYKMIIKLLLLCWLFSPFLIITLLYVSKSLLLLSDLFLATIPVCVSLVIWIQIITLRAVTFGAIVTASLRWTDTPSLCLWFVSCLGGLRPHSSSAALPLMLSLLPSLWNRSKIIIVDCNAPCAILVLGEHKWLESLITQTYQLNAYWCSIVKNWAQWSISTLSVLHLTHVAFVYGALIHCYLRWMKMNKDEIFNYLDQFQWGRLSNGTVYVWTPGYQGSEWCNLNKFLVGHKVRVLSSKFDKVCGKTQLVIKGI